MEIKTINIVIEMRKKGMEIPFIADIVKLSEEEVLRILKGTGFIRFGAF